MALPRGLDGVGASECPWDRRFHNHPMESHPLKLLRTLNKIATKGMGWGPGMGLPKYGSFFLAENQKNSPPILGGPTPKTRHSHGGFEPFRFLGLWPSKHPSPKRRLLKHCFQLRPWQTVPRFRRLLTEAFLDTASEACKPAEPWLRGVAALFTGSI